MSNKNFADNLNEALSWLALARIEHTEQEGAKICSAALNYHKGNTGQAPPSNVKDEFVEVTDPKVTPPQKTFFFSLKLQLHTTMNKKILILDTETTGLPADMKAPYTDVDNWPHMLSVAWGIFDENGTLLRKANYIVAPRIGVSNSPEAMAVNNITPAYQKEHGSECWQIVNSLRVAMDTADVIVAHNVAFDKNIIGAEFARLKMQMPDRHWFCTKEDIGNLLNLPPTPAQKKYRPEITYKQPRLDELYQFLFNTPIPGREEYHGAEQDAAACAACFWELKKRGKIKI